MDRCPKCGSAYVRGFRDERFDMDGLTALVQVPTLTCNQCKLTETDASLAQMELAFAGFVSRAGTGSGHAFRLFRKALGLRATQLAQWLNLRPETLSRWENRQGTVDRAAWPVLAAMVEDRLEGRTRTLDRVQASAAPRPSTRTVKIGLDGLEVGARDGSRTLTRGKTRGRRSLRK
jgi:DNA-binding transcriptional regulator YiaG